MPDYNYSIFKLNKLCSYSPEPRTEVCCFRRADLNRSKLVYYKLRIETNHIIALRQPFYRSLPGHKFNNLNCKYYLNSCDKAFLYRVAFFIRKDFVHDEH